MPGPGALRNNLSLSGGAGRGEELCATNNNTRLHARPAVSGGRRSAGRTCLEQKAYVTAIAVTSGLIIFAGRLSSAKDPVWVAAKRKLDRQLRRLSSSKHLRTWIQNLKAAYRDSNEQRSARAAAFAPGWTLVLYSLSNLQRVSSLPAVLLRSMTAALAFCRPAPECGKDLNPFDYTTSGYALSRAAKEEAFRLIIPARLALPPAGRQPVDVIRWFGWPYKELLNRIGECKYTKMEMRERGRPPTPKVYMEAGHDYAELVTLLLERNMARLYSPDEAPRGPNNGAFAVAKDASRDRFILDGSPGNFIWNQEAFQRLYEDILGSQPERAAAMGLTKRLMPIPGPDALCLQPPGLTAITSTDFENCFYLELQLEEMLGSQRLPPLPGHLVGRPDLQKVIPVIHVMCMGNWLSCLLTQLAHRHAHAPLVRAPTVVRDPQFQHPSRRKAYHELTANHGGSVPLCKVPEVLLPQGLRQLLPGELEVPTSAFDLELVTELATLRPSGASEPQLVAQVADQPGLHYVFTIYVVDGHETAAALRWMTKRARATQRTHHLAASLLYVDDNNTMHYTVVGGRPRRAQARGNHSMANLHAMLTVYAALAYGFKQSWKKLEWARLKPCVILGVLVRPRASRGLRLEVHPRRRARTVDGLLKVAYSPLPFVEERLLDSLIGNLVWEVLCNRHFLCVLRVVYKARDSPNRPRMKVLLTEALREELWMAAVLSPLYFSETREYADVVATYDASGRNAHGEGGYGMAYRTGVPRSVAAELATSVGGLLGRTSAFEAPQPGVPPPDRLCRPLLVSTVKQASMLLAHAWSRRARDSKTRTSEPLRTRDTALTWRAALHGEFNMAPRCIALAEIVTGVMTAKWLSHRPGAAGLRFVVGGDNTVATVALHKGRSSTRDLNLMCRRVACIAFVGDVAFTWFWLPSASNPADGPSRWWLESKWRRQRRRLTSPAYQGGMWVRDITDEGFPPHPGPHAKHPFRGRRPVSVGASLLRGAVLASTSVTYVQALEGLDYYVMTFGTGLPLADVLRNYVEDCFASGWVPKSTCKRALTALVYYSPEAKSSNVTGLAWKALAGWDKAVPPVSHLPVPYHLNCLFAWYLLSQGDVDAASATMIAFDGYLRGSELDNLRIADVRLPGHPLNFHPKRASLFLRKTKAQRPQHVTVDNTQALVILRFQLAWRWRAGARGDDFLFDRRVPGSILTRYKKAQVLAGYKKPMFVRHSWRHGGATDDFLNGRRALEETTVRGRWSGLRVTRRYLQELQSLLLGSDGGLPLRVKSFFTQDLRRAERLVCTYFGAPMR